MQSQRVTMRTHSHRRHLVAAAETPVEPSRIYNSHLRVTLLVYKSGSHHWRMTSIEDTEMHLSFLRLALDEARKCVPTPTAFCVGAVITVRYAEHFKPAVLATGYSRELPGNTHAEANALTKARQLTAAELRELIPSISSDVTIDDLLSKADIYTTMEPCSVRTSGLAPCADGIVAARLRRCLIGVSEPDDFVKCEGAQKLKDGGVEVIWVKGLEQECLEVARTGH